MNKKAPLQAARLFLGKAVFLEKACSGGRLLQVSGSCICRLFPHGGYIARRRVSKTSQIIIYMITAVVATSMIISLIGPILMRPPAPPTLPPPPTWTPLPPPTSTPTPFPTPTETPTSIPALVPTLGPPPPDTEGSLDVPAKEPGELVFAVAGDSRNDPEVYQRILDRIVADGNAFLIHTGDLVNYGSAQTFEPVQDMMNAFPLPFYPVPGNHDRDDDGTLNSYLSYSGAPDKHYSFDVEMAHLTMANSATGRLSDEELAWIDADLLATDQPVKIVCLHHPPFDPDSTSHILRGGNEAFMDLMRKHQVAYVFASHIHAYSEAERDGTVYVITGGAGAPLYADEHPNAFYHYVQVRIEGTDIRTAVVRLD